MVRGMDAEPGFPDQVTNSSGFLGRALPIERLHQYLVSVKST